MVRDGRANTPSSMSDIRLRATSRMATHPDALSLAPGLGWSR
jgi:hypothetical protein